MGGFVVTRAGLRDTRFGLVADSFEDDGYTRPPTSHTTLAIGLEGIFHRIRFGLDRSSDDIDVASADASRKLLLNHDQWSAFVGYDFFQQNQLSAFLLAGAALGEVRLDRKAGRLPSLGRVSTDSLELLTVHYSALLVDVGVEYLFPLLSEATLSPAIVLGGRLGYVRQVDDGEWIGRNAINRERTYSGVARINGSGWWFRFTVGVGVLVP